MQASAQGTLAASLSDRWVRPSVILVPTALNDLSRLGPFALQQAEQLQARLILLHVLGSGTAFSIDPAGLPFYDPASAQAYADKAMAPVCQEARRRGIACDTLLREGNVAQQIATAARQFRAGRLLMGTRGHSKLGKLLLGSVAEQVLRSVQLPVMTVGPEAHLQVDRGDRQPVVLYATTLRETSRPSAALACQVAASMAAKLLLLHVLPAADEMQRQGLPEGLDALARHELELLARQSGCASGLSIEAVIVHGNPHIEILAEASEREADLIVLGSSSRTALENLTRDRVVFRVLAHARSPVLTLLEPVAEKEDALTDSLAIPR
jgi:nucleotide-binding universal stress UspA family protein